VTALPTNEKITEEKMEMGRKDVNRTMTSN